MTNNLSPIIIKIIKPIVYETHRIHVIQRHPSRQMPQLTELTKDGLCLNPWRFLGASLSYPVNVFH